eukprot:scaffold108519_cov36-Tisochrysis_lutea.AAC.2
MSPHRPLGWELSRERAQMLRWSTWPAGHHDCLYDRVTTRMRPASAEPVVLRFIWQTSPARMCAGAIGPKTWPLHCPIPLGLPICLSIVPVPVCRGACWTARGLPDATHARSYAPRGAIALTMRPHTCMCLVDVCGVCYDDCSLMNATQQPGSK